MPTVKAQDPKLMDRLLRQGFGSKRKMLRNNLTATVDRDRLNDLLQQLSIDPQARAEDLSVEDWVGLSNSLSGSPV